MFNTRKQIPVPFLVILSFCILVACEKGRETRTLIAPHTERIHDSIHALDSLASILVLRNNELADIFATRAIRLSSQIHSVELLIKSLNIKGLVMSINQYDSAFYYFHAALGLSDSARIQSEKAYILYNLAQLFYLANDFRNAIILLDSSIHIGQSLSQASAVSASLIALGNIYLITEEFQKAKELYDSALQIAEANHLYREMGVAWVNLAQFQEEADSAVAYLRRSLEYLSQQNGTEEEQINAEINLAMRIPDPDSAIGCYQRVIRKATKYQMPVERLGAYNNIAYKYLQKGAAAEAEKYIRDTAILLALEVANYDWLATLYDTYSDILLQKREFRNALENLRQSIEARAVSDRIIAEQQVRLLNAVLDLKNKNLLISETERLLTRKDARIARMRFWLALSGGLILLATGFIFWIRQRARIKLQHGKLEAARKIIEAEEHEKERNAMELHDAMGVLIAKVSETVQHLFHKDPSARPMIERHFHEFSAGIRNISHRLSKKILEKHPFHSLVNGICEDAIRYSNLNLSFSVGEAHGTLPAETALHVIRIIQELLTNARKYANQAEIRLIIQFADERLVLIYSDNGPGFGERAEKITGMGFSNIFARVNLINGHAELDSEPGHGVYWKITAPVT